MELYVVDFRLEGANATYEHKEMFATMEAAKERAENASRYSRNHIAYVSTHKLAPSMQFEFVSCDCVFCNGVEH